MAMALKRCPEMMNPYEKIDAYGVRLWSEIRNLSSEMEKCFPSKIKWKSAFLICRRNTVWGLGSAVSKDEAALSTFQRLSIMFHTWRNAKWRGIVIVNLVDVHTTVFIKVYCRFERRRKGRYSYSSSRRTDALKWQCVAAVVINVDAWVDFTWLDLSNMTGY